MVRKISSETRETERWEVEIPAGTPRDEVFRQLAKLPSDAVFDTVREYATKDSLIFTASRVIERGVTV